MTQHSHHPDTPVGAASGAERGGRPRRRLRKRLIASIHHVHPRSLAAVERPAAQFERNLRGRRFATLVVPDHWSRNTIAGNARFAARLRGWADQGIEMFVHGWFHHDRSEHSGVAALTARHMTRNRAVGRYADLLAAA